MTFLENERMRSFIHIVYIQHKCPVNLFFAGITLISVDRLNLLKVAPGGHVGRFCIWTQSAFSRLDNIYGTWRKGSQEKTGYKYVILVSWIRWLFADHLACLFKCIFLTVSGISDFGMGVWLTWSWLKLRLLCYTGCAVDSFLCVTVYILCVIPAFRHWRWRRQIWPSCWRVRRYRLPWEPPSKFWHLLVQLILLCCLNLSFSSMFFQITNAWWSIQTFLFCHIQW